MSWKVLKIFAQKWSNDDLGLTLTFFVVRSNLLSGLSYGEEIIELVEDLGAKVNKYVNIFCNIGQDHSLTPNKCLS